MKTRLLSLFDALSTNFWLIPLLFLISAVGLAYLNYYLDMTVISHDYTFYPIFLHFANHDNIRTVLSVCATSVLGVAGVSFSITIASLTLASQQYGSRLLRNFMQDRFNQVVLGIFIGTFLYSVSVLQFTSSMEAEGIRPIISMTTLMALMIISLLALVLFIHHIAMSIQANSIIKSVDDELRSHLLIAFPEEIIEEPLFLQASVRQPALDFEADGKHIYAKVSGYLVGIDYQRLMTLAQDHNLVINLPVKSGQFITQGHVIAQYLHGSGITEKDGIEDKIRNALMTGQSQTPVQDPEFAIRQLVEVAVRALSSGINDPFTAITCVDRLGDNIAFLMCRQFPAPQRFDEDGQIKLQLKVVDFQGVVDVSFNQVRQHGKTDIAVIIKLLMTLATLAKQVKTKEQATAIRDQASAIMSDFSTLSLAEKDQQETQERYQVIIDTLIDY